jgi:hypothetical protein
MSNAETVNISWRAFFSKIQMFQQKSSSGNSAETFSAETISISAETFSAETFAVLLKHSQFC